MKLSKAPRPGALRIARFTFPDGTTKDVLQQSYVSEWERWEGRAVVEVGSDVEWRDVPLWHVPYESPR